MEHYLAVNNLNYSYGGIHALGGVNLHVAKKEIVALIGANGAGKTTTLQCISGLLGAPEKGEIIFDGINISGKKPHEISKLGLTQVLEGRKIFPHLTVKENLILGAYAVHEDTTKELKEIYHRFPRLKEREKQYGGTLSGGEQQMLAIGRALMSKPKIILMDEPSLGLAPFVINEVFSIIKDINSEGIPILLVEQNSKVALTAADRAYVIETGQIIVSGSAKELMNDELIIKSYLGG